MRKIIEIEESLKQHKQMRRAYFRGWSYLSESRDWIFDITFTNILFLLSGWLGTQSSEVKQKQMHTVRDAQQFNQHFNMCFNFEHVFKAPDLCGTEGYA